MKSVRELLVLILLALAASAYGQATVYIVRYGSNNPGGAHKKFPVLIDGAQVGKLGANRFLELQVPSGKHVVTSSDKQSGVSLDATDGNSYYIRLEDAGAWTLHGRCSAMQNGEGVEAVKMLTAQ